MQAFAVGIPSPLWGGKAAAKGRGEQHALAPATTPLPASPTRGEVPVGAFGTALPHSPTRTLPLGEGVFLSLFNRTLP
jgi:hypothetical protein